MDNITSPLVVSDIKNIASNHQQPKKEEKDLGILFFFSYSQGPKEVNGSKLAFPSILHS